MTLFLPADNSRENYRDVICTVMRQLLRKNFDFVVQAHLHTSWCHIHLGRKAYYLYLFFSFFFLQITSWNTQKMIQSLFSPL